MAQQYAVTTGVTATAAAGTAIVAVQLATPATQTALLIGLDVAFDGSTPATANLVELVRETGVSSGGAVFTPEKYGTDQGKAALTTARINDTTDGAGPTVIQAWQVSNTGLLSYLWPLGRELYIPVSGWLAVRVTVPTGGSTGHYLVNAIFEE